MRHRLHPPLGVAVTAACAALVACGGGRESSPDDDPFARPPAVLQGPELRIGSVDDPDFAYTRISALLPLPDGRVLSLHPEEAILRRWTAEGRPDGTIGRQGEGPGEFQRPFGLGAFGDSVWVFDLGAYRATYVDAEGALLGTATPGVDLGLSSPDAPPPPRPTTPLRDGTWIGQSPAWSQAIAEGTLTEVPTVRLSADGAVLDTIWIQDYRTQDVLALLRETGGTFTRQPFGDGSMGFPGPDDVFTVLDRRVSPTAAESAFHLTRIAPTGDTVARRTVPYDPVPLDPARADSAADAQAAGMIEFMQRVSPGASEASLAADLREAMYVPPFEPWVRSMKLTREGGVWLERQSTDGSGTEWWRFDGDLEPRGRVRTPEGLTVLAIDGDDVWGVERDEFDVDYIVRYRIAEGG